MQDENEPWAPELFAAFWLNHASRLLLRTHEARLRPLGFGMGSVPVLTALADGRALSQKELTEVARVEQPTMAEMLVRLERDGIVQRKQNPNDKRASLFTLTRVARARLAKAREALVQGDQEAMAGFSEKERAALIQMLQRVAANLERKGGSTDRPG